MASDDAADRLLRARALAERIGESLGTHVEQFQTSGVESRPNGPFLIYRYRNVDLIEIALYAIDGRRHIVFQQGARRRYGSATVPFKIYNNDDNLVSAVVASMLKMKSEVLHGRG